MITIHPANPLVTSTAQSPVGQAGRPLSDQAAAQYLLVCHANSIDFTRGIWCFNLESLSGQTLLEAADEDEGDLNRLSLLAAVRGLEAIDGASAVSLVSNNRYLIRSLDQSLPRWRENDFVWEHFGRRVPVQNADLWRRIDRTLAIHQVTASLIQTTRVSGQMNGPAGQPAGEPMGQPAGEPAGGLAGGLAPVLPAAGPQASNRLRNWLTGNDDITMRPIRRRRYRTEDLALD